MSQFNFGLDNKLSSIQKRSILALNERVQATPKGGTVAVSDAAQAALQAAWTAVKASGQPIDPDMAVKAKELGLV